MLKQTGIRKMRKGYYSADTIHGVRFYDAHMDLDVDVLDPGDFYDQLDTLDEDETIYTFFDETDAEIFADIESEYGIH